MTRNRKRAFQHAIVTLLPVLLLLALLGVWVSACTYDPNVPDGVQACSIESAQCPIGYACRSGRCWRDGSMTGLGFLPDGGLPTLGRLPPVSPTTPRTAWTTSGGGSFASGNKRVDVWIGGTATTTPATGSAGATLAPGPFNQLQN